MYLSKQVVVDPRSFYACDHHFCRKCVSIDTSCKCPSCGVPAWTKDLKPNQQLDNLVYLTASLKDALFSELGSPEGVFTAFNELLDTNQSSSSTKIGVDDFKPVLDYTLSSSISMKTIQPAQAHHHTHSVGEVKVTPKQTVLMKVRKRNVKGETALHLAAIKGDVAGATTLITQGADCNAKDNAGWTALHEACNHGHVEVARVLLEHGAIVNTAGFENNTPLHDAAINGHLPVATLLMSFGANPKLRNTLGQTPQNVASTDAIRNVLTSPGNCAAQLASPIQQKCSKVILLGTGLKDDEKALLSQLSELLHGEVVASFSPQVSHIITHCNSQKCCARTLKSLFGVAVGTWVVSFEWVTETLKNSCQQQETLFEIKGFVLQDSSMTTNAPQKSRENAALGKPHLYDGCNFYFSGTFLPPSLSRSDLCSLVTYAGGNLLKRMPKPSGSPFSAFASPFHAKPGSSFEKCHTFIVLSQSLETSSENIPAEIVQSVSYTWILDCLTSFELLERT